MPAIDYATVFSADVIDAIFPKDRADQFFDALFGDAEEGAYDISLAFKGETAGRLEFEFQLSQRPGKCLVCSLTYGLPDVFKRHPIININGVVAAIGKTLNLESADMEWELGRTREISRAIHVIPLSVAVKR
ncbi:MAG: pancreas/duodenum homeobox protein 1 [Deltaproteobacteria bacterium]|nr:MAG: pancreas/duodenum homeobox protein 1 [Deltaproteobacteria bacterium]